MVINDNVPRGAKCVFSSCEHAPATHMAWHEFTNYGPKPLCGEHAKKVNQYFSKGWRTK